MKVDVFTDGDKLLTRLLIGLQAELGLKRLRFEVLADLLASVLRGEAMAGELAHIEPEGVAQRIEALNAAGWVHINRENPHVSAALDGVIVCGALALPESIVSRLEKRLTQDSLREALA